MTRGRGAQGSLERRALEAVEALVPGAIAIDVRVEGGRTTVRVRVQGSDGDRTRLQGRLAAVLHRTIDQQLQVEVVP